MGDEADALNDQGDWGAEDDMRQRDRESARKYREERRAFKAGVKSEVERQLKQHGIQKKPYVPKGEMVDQICACGCGQAFQARKADVKRGWGKFASKSCSAKYKDIKNHGIYRDQYGT